MARWRLCFIFPILPIISDFLMTKCFETPISLRIHMFKTSETSFSSKKLLSYYSDSRKVVEKKDFWVVGEESGIVSFSLVAKA